MIEERQYISSGIIEAINEIANKFARHLEALDNQLKDKGIKFESKDQELIEYTKNTFNINPAYQKLVSPDTLILILDDIKNKDKEFDVVWPNAVAAVRRGQQTRREELKDSLIPNQRETFRYFYSDIQKTNWLWLVGTAKR